MAARIAAIDLELQNLDAQRISLGANTYPHSTIAQLRTAENIQERMLEDIRRQVKDATEGVHLHATVKQLRSQEYHHRSRLMDIQHKVERLLQSKEAEEVDQALKNLDTEEAALEHERTMCGHIITAEAFHSSPIRWVPDEILTEIFVAAKDGEHDLVGTGIASVVTRVCARWRHVACAYPRLWSSFIFPLFGRQGTVDLLQMTLERCRAAGLAIIVDASEDRGLSGDPTMALLAKYTVNMVSLRFRGKELLREFPAFDAFRDRLPRLELLGFTHMLRIAGDAFAHAPRLHMLELGRSADLLELHSFLPTAQISSIRFTESTSGFHLGAFPNLTSMASVQTVQSFPVLVPQHPPTLSCLKTWHTELPKPQQVDPYRVHMSSALGPPPLPPNSAVNFFARFRTPALRTLHIRRLTSVEGVIQLFRDSQCALTSLVLEEPLVPADDLLRLLAHTPDLLTLEILSGQPAALNNGFFRSLTMRNDPLSDILPCLTHFRVEGSYEFGTDSLLAMIESRTAGGSHERLSTSARSTLPYRTGSSHRNECDSSPGAMTLLLMLPIRRAS
jgi:hypothetical protein